MVSGTAGTGLTLLYLSKTLGRDDALELASAAGRRMIELSMPMTVGRRWEMWPGYTREMPNFSHGTAGMAYFLASVGGETGNAEFVDAAVDGARYLQSIADVDGDSYLIHHNSPEGLDLYYLSWCHGPVGTSRLFWRLHELSGASEWLDWVHMGARGIMGTGVPENRTSGFWENVSQCGGNAGLGEYFLALQRMYGNAEYGQFVQRLNDDLLGRTTEGSDQAWWKQSEHRVRPELLVAQTGFMQGAAGVGKYFLHVDTMEQSGAGPAVILPDAPF
jgi:lantibiotic modifying enzyme